MARQGSGVFVRSTVQPEADLTTSEQVHLLTRELAAAVRKVQLLAERVAELESLVHRPPPQ